MPGEVSLSGVVEKCLPSSGCGRGLHAPDQRADGGCSFRTSPSDPMIRASMESCRRRATSPRRVAQLCRFRR